MSPVPLAFVMAGKAESSGKRESAPEAETVQLWRTAASCERGEARAENVPNEIARGET